jgi:hypothetical protein
MTAGDGEENTLETKKGKIIETLQAARPTKILKCTRRVSMYPGKIRGLVRWRVGQSVEARPARLQSLDWKLGYVKGKSFCQFIKDLKVITEPSLSFSDVLTWPQKSNEEHLRTGLKLALLRALVSCQARGIASVVQVHCEWVELGWSVGGKR